MVDRAKNMIVFNPDLGKDEKEEIISLVESFSRSKNWISYDVLLRAILFCLVFYLINSELIVVVLDRYLPKLIDKVLIQSIIFGIMYYIISIQI